MDFFARVHDEGTLAGHGLVEGLGGEQQEAHRLRRGHETHRFTFASGQDAELAGGKKLLPDNAFTFEDIDEAVMLAGYWDNAFGVLQSGPASPGARS